MTQDESVRVAALREVLDRSDLPEGVELRPGFGSEYWIESMSPATNDYGERELVVVIATGTEGAALKGEAKVSLADQSHLLVAGGPSDAELLAEEASFQISQIAYEMLDGVPDVDVDVDAVAAELGGVDRVDAAIVSSLAGHGAARRASAGVLMVSIAGDGAGDVQDVEIHVTSQQIFDSVLGAEVAHRRGTPIDQAEMPGGLGMVLIHLDETLGTLRPDEHHIVMVGAQFRQSVRADLPPLRGAVESFDPSPGGRWFSEDPDGTRHYFDEDDQA